MNKTEVLGAFLLANIPEIITQEEFDDVKKAIKELQQEKEGLINYLKEQIKHIDDLVTKGKPKPYGEELNLYENSKLRYLEILSKIEKSDK